MFYLCVCNMSCYEYVGLILRIRLLVYYGTWNIVAAFYYLLFQV